MTALSKSQYELEQEKRTIPASGTTGAVAVGTGAGTAEENLLAVRALGQIADQVKDKVVAACKSATRNGESEIAAGAPAAGRDADALPTVVIYLGDDHPSHAPVEIFKRTVTQLRGELSQAGVKLPNDPAAPAAAGIAVAAATAFLSYFKTDYSIQGNALTTDNGQLGAVIAERLSAVSAGTYFASEADPEIDSTVTAQLQDLQARADVAVAQAKSLRNQIAALPKDDPRGVPLDLQATRFEKAAADVQTFMVALQTADATGDTPILKISRELALEAQPNRCNLQVKVVNSAGTTYTEKNLLSSIGFMPFYVSTTVTATYRIWGRDNRLRSAGLLAARTPFASLNALSPKATRPATSVAEAH
jgi:hypothetical protein